MRRNRLFRAILLFNINFLYFAVGGSPLMVVQNASKKVNSFMRILLLLRNSTRHQTCLSSEKGLLRAQPDDCHQQRKMSECIKARSILIRKLLSKWYLHGSPLRAKKIVCEYRRFSLAEKKFLIRSCHWPEMPSRQTIKFGGGFFQHHIVRHYHVTLSSSIFRPEVFCRSHPPSHPS